MHRRVSQEPQAISRKPQVAFTLIELLVVVAIIVILLAVLVPGLEKALRVAERAKCGANQRNIAQPCAIYAFENKRAFPRAANNGNTYGATAMDVRQTLSNPDPLAPITGSSGPTYAASAVGWGRLVITQQLPSTKLGEIIHCPSLDTTSGAPVNFGMDVAEYSANGSECAGGSTWVSNAAEDIDDRILASYNYRGRSYESTHGGGVIRMGKAGSAFVLSSDFISTHPTATNPNYGRKFHHGDGWNIAYGDGHASYYRDPNADKGDPATQGFVENTVIGDNSQFPGPNATYPNGTADAEINGEAVAGADEAVFDYFGKH